MDNIVVAAATAVTAAGVDFLVIFHDKPSNWMSFGGFVALMKDNFLVYAPAALAVQYLITDGDTVKQGVACGALAAGVDYAMRTGEAGVAGTFVAGTLGFVVARVIVAYVQKKNE